MMATAEAPDPRNLESWDQAFQYPVVTVRGLEKKLRSSLTENQDKLRTLVGASYRDLLGTARTIIDIDTKMHHVESLIADAGRKADSRNFDKLSRNVSSTEAQWARQKHAQFSHASEMATLKSCLATVANLLKSRGSTILAAKLLGLAYLLHKSLTRFSSQDKEPRDFLARLESVKERLLRYIDRRLAVTTASIDSLVEDLAAFSFATRASLLDTLRHFHHVRATTLRAAREPAENDIESQVKRRLSLFLSTVSASRSIFPDVLSAALKTLANRNILTDPSILAIDSLRLDVHSRWFHPDIRNFTPWTRHDELPKADSERALKSWAEQALQALPPAIERDLNAEYDPATLSSIRRNVLQSWLSSRRIARGATSRAVLSQLQAPFLRRFEALIKDAAAGLQDSVAASVTDYVETWKQQSSEKTLPSLWASCALAVDPSDGGRSFRNALVARRNGNTDSVIFVTSVFEDAASKLVSLYNVAKAMRDIRWDDDYDEDSNFHDSDEEDANDSVLQALSRRDPEAIESLILKSTSRSLLALQSGLEASEVLTDLEVPSPTSPAIFVIRALRAIRVRATQLQFSLNSTPASTASFCGRLFTTIQDSLSRAVDDRTSPRLESAIRTFTARPTRIRALWDGRPETPVQPGPWAFSYLRALVKTMADFGPDLWTVDAVDSLKRLAASKVATRVEQLIDEADGPASSMSGIEPGFVKHHKARPSGAKTGQTPAEINGSTDSDEVVDEDISREDDHKGQQQDTYLQLSFDALYLQTALCPSNATAGASPENSDQVLSRVAQRLIKHCKVDDAITERINKVARDYWRRTYLLFGLLAN